MTDLSNIWTAFVLGCTTGLGIVLGIWLRRHPPGRTQCPSLLDGNRSWQCDLHKHHFGPHLRRRLFSTEQWYDR
jgi:hypothetical protein